MNTNALESRHEQLPITVIRPSSRQRSIFSERFGVGPLSKMTGLSEDVLAELVRGLSAQNLDLPFASSLRDIGAPPPVTMLFRLFLQKPKAEVVNGTRCEKRRYKLSINSVMGLLNLTMTAYGTRPSWFKKKPEFVVVIDYGLITPDDIFRVEHRYLINDTAKSWRKFHTEKNNLLPKIPGLSNY